MLDNFYRYLSGINSTGHTLLVAAVLASAGSLLSLIGTDLVFQDVQSPIIMHVKVLSYILPFVLVLILGFLLIRGHARLARHNRILAEIADRDELTRLANRAAFYRKGGEMATRAELKNEALSLIMLDADHFKTINDTHGHLAGDMALQHLAKVLRDASRENDLVARWGGEEFAILLSSSELEGAQAFAERLRTRVADSPFYWEDKEIIVTLSAGVSAWHKPDDDFVSLIRRADKALYQAKSSGRNKVHICRQYVDQVEGYVQDVQFRDTAV